MNVRPLYRLLGLLVLVAPLMTGAAAAQTNINAPHDYGPSDGWPRHRDARA